MKFDEFMPLSEQTQWLNDLSFRADFRSRGRKAGQDKDRLRDLLWKRLNWLLKQTYSDELIEVERAYLSACIPKVIEGEGRFWTCTLRTAKNIASRINLSRQLVFEVGEYDGIPKYRFYLTRELLAQEFGANFEGLHELAELEVQPSRLKAGGFPQCYVELMKYQDALKLINHPDFLKLVRRFNLNLLKQHNSTPTQKNHYYLFADLLFENQSIDFDSTLFEEDGVVSLREGQSIESIHKTRYRNKRIVQEAKQQFQITHNGRLFCEICGFDFSKHYGELGKDYIEAHHEIPVSELDSAGEAVSSDNLIMLCPNCHRMIHRKNPPYTVDELRQIVMDNRPVT